MVNFNTKISPLFPYYNILCKFRSPSSYLFKSETRNSLFPFLSHQSLLSPTRHPRDTLSKHQKQVVDFCVDSGGRFSTVPAKKVAWRRFSKKAEFSRPFPVAKRGNSRVSLALHQGEIHTDDSILTPTILINHYRQICMILIPVHKTKGRDSN